MLEIPLGGGDDVSAAMERVAAIALEDTLTLEAAEDVTLLWGDSGIQVTDSIIRRRTRGIIVGVVLLCDVRPHGLKRTT